MESIVVKDFTIRMKDGYFSLTDVAKNLATRPPNEVIRDWLRKQGTLAFLEEWEIANNTNHVQMPMFSLNDLSNDRGITIKRYIDSGGTGIISSAGRTGGTYADIIITLNFTSWLKPRFSVWFFTEWVRMKEQEMSLTYKEWTLNKIISNSLENSILAESLKDSYKNKDDGSA